MKKLLIDVHQFSISKQQLIEGKSPTSGNPIVEGPLATVEIKNGNGRYYSRELWEREMEKYQQIIENNNAMGELDHPDSQVVNLKNVSHIIRGFEWDGNDIIGKIEILPTTSGNILKALVENNVTVGVSSRGMGSLKQVGEIMEVQDDFELLCWDFVSNPSNSNSWMRPSTQRAVAESLIESKSSNIKNYEMANKIITEILCSKGQCPIDYIK